MTQQLLEQTVRDWVAGNPARGAATLGRLAGTLTPGQSAEDIADALICIAGKMELAETRVW